MKPSAAVALLVALVAGCGGSHGGERLARGPYEQRVNAIFQRDGSRVARLSLAISRAPLPRLVRPRLALLRSTLEDEAAALAALRPPEDAEQAHDALVSGLRGMSLTAARLVDAGPDARAERPYAAVADELASSGPASKVAGALDELRRHGYRIR